MPIKLCCICFQAAGVQIGSCLNFISTFIITCTFSLIYQWKLSLILHSFSPLILFSIYFEQKALQNDAKKSQKILDKSAKVNSTVKCVIFLYFVRCVFQIAVEAISNIRTVASLGCEDVFQQLYVSELVPYQRTTKTKSHFRGVVLGMARSLLLFAYAAGMAYGTKLIVDQEVNYGIVFTYVLISAANCTPLKRSVAAYFKMFRYRSCISFNSWFTSSQSR